MLWHIIFLALYSSAQAQEIKDTLAFDAFIEQTRILVKEDSLQAYKDIQKAIATSYDLNYKRGRAEAYNLMGDYYLNWSKDFEQSITYYQEALFIYYNLGDKVDEFTMTSKISRLYFNHQDPENGVNVFLESLKKHPNDPFFGCLANNALAGIMKTNDDGEKAIEYFDKSEEWFTQLVNPDDDLWRIQLSNDKNRGVVYRNFEKFDTAQFYLMRSLDRSIEMKDSSWIARNYNSLGLMYEMQGDYEKAEKALVESLALKRSQNYIDGVVTSLTNLANLKIQMGDFKAAQNFLSEAESLIDRVADPRKLQIYQSGSVVYSALGNYKKAFEFLSFFNELSEVFNREERSKIATELEAQYQNEANKILKEKLEAELQTSRMQEEQKEGQLRRQRIFILLGTIIGVILLGLLWIAYRANVKRKAANEELQKKNEEITQQNQQIELQKSQIQVKNTEILDSINYAKRIQEAILPGEDLVKKLLGESFIYYQPKDIVSGDFYFVEETPTHYFWAAADCTGHGVPGAMVSVVCHNALNRSVHEFGLTKPGEILDKTRELVLATFKKSEHQVKDGMDISLIARKKETNILQFAGANNPIWLISEAKAETDYMLSEDGKFELKEVKGDKQPVGMHFDMKPFTTHEFTLEKNQLVYVLTDGYADQFGGEKGKKFKYKNLKALILNSVGKGLKDQEKHIQQTFEDWKKGFEQLDDVCLIGVKF